MLDGICGRSPPLYTSYTDIWSLEEWWTINDCFRKLCSDYFAKALSPEQVADLHFCNKFSQVSVFSVGTSISVSSICFTCGCDLRYVIALTYGV